MTETLLQKWQREVKEKVSQHNNICSKIDELTSMRESLKSEILILQGKVQAVGELKKELDEVPNTASGGAQ